MTQLQRAARVGGVKEVFDRDAVGPALREERGQPGVNLQQLFGKRRAGRMLMAPLMMMRWRDPSVSTQP